MRFVTTTLVVVALAAASGLAFQRSETGAAAKPTRACSILSRDLVIKYANNKSKQAIDLTDRMGAQEETIGARGSACDYGDIRLQIDPFARDAEMRKSPAQDWTPVPGVGDTAFFRNNRSMFAELIVWTGSHHFTIQMSVPMGGTVDAVKSKTIGLAHDLIPKLR